MELYKVRRYYSDFRKPKTILNKVSLKVAQLHCECPHTKGITKNGVKYFDGYIKIKRSVQYNGKNRI